jgi:hypothetical protein
MSVLMGFSPPAHVFWSHKGYAILML